MKKSLYIHIPFCGKKCAYCDFYSTAYTPALARSYLESICEEINGLEGDFSTIYIGGGTPTILELNLWDKLLKALGRIAKDRIEFTVEANPESVTKAKLACFRKGGVNRISLGVQSFSEVKLKKLGRRHSLDQAIAAIALAKGEGFKNLSIDLIFGVEGEDLGSWQRELSEAVRMPLAHLSLYALTYEKRTPFFKELRKGKIVPLSEGTVAELYAYALGYLPRKKFYQYEVSNFSKRGFQSAHNLNYWQNNDYLGLGPSAASYSDGKRTKNIRSVEGYIRRIKRKISPVDFQEKLTFSRKIGESLALRIRTKDGINFEEFKKKYGLGCLESRRVIIEDLFNQGLIKWKEGGGKKTGICLTENGFLFCDTVSSALL